MRPIVLFLSTGRCGTQWLASSLAAAYGDSCTVTHEPLGPRYRPPSFYRDYRQLERMLEVPEIEQHLSYVAETSRHRPYIETGWPCYSAIPLFIERFGERVRVVHLTRHPVPNALSLMTHRFYQAEERQDAYTQLAQLSPSCAGVIQEQLATPWERMSPYEKCLFWWTEIQLYARELEERYPRTPFLRIRAEEIFEADPQSMAGLLDFLDLPTKTDLLETRADPVDRWKRKTHLPLDWRQIAAYPRCLAAAAELGYDWEDVDARSLRRRYRTGLLKRIPRAFSQRRSRRAGGATR